MTPDWQATAPHRITRVYNLLAGRCMAQPEAGDVTRLLQSWIGGDKSALGELVPFVYRELRGLAAAYIRRERRDHTLQPTALAHEAYLMLVDQTQVQSPSRAILRHRGQPDAPDSGQSCQASWRGQAGRRQQGGS
jgi:hypothetical protein